MKVVYYNSEWTDDDNDFAIFLAGPTVRSHQSHLISWRNEAIEEFKKQDFSGTLFVPEFGSTGEGMFSTETNNIIKWELTKLERADTIMFWVPRTEELIGLTTNCEFGYWINEARHKIIYGRPKEAYRCHYLDQLWKYDAERRMAAIDDKIYDNLHDTVQAAIENVYEKE